MNTTQCIVALMLGSFLAFIGRFDVIAQEAGTDASADSGALFENVRLFTGADELSPSSNVLVVGNLISEISTDPKVDHKNLLPK